jgi:hypothetical protein
MVRHTVMFTFRDGVGDEEIERIFAELSRLPAVIPQLRDYRMGRDIGVNTGNAQLMVTGDFDSVADYLAYRDHDEHRRIVRDLIAPLVAQRSACQIEC